MEHLEDAALVDMAARVESQLRVYFDKWSGRNDAIDALVEASGLVFRIRRAFWNYRDFSRFADRAMPTVTVNTCSNLLALGQMDDLRGFLEVAKVRGLDNLRKLSKASGQTRSRTGVAESVGVEPIVSAERKRPTEDRRADVYKLHDQFVAEVGRQPTQQELEDRCRASGIPDLADASRIFVAPVIEARKQLALLADGGCEKAGSKLDIEAGRAEIEAECQSAAMNWYAEAKAKFEKEVLKPARAVMGMYKGIVSQEELTAILFCVHPDNSASPEQRLLAFRAINSARELLCPTKGNSEGMPNATFGQMVSLYRGKKRR